VSDIYGKLMFSHGAAGLLAPWLTGQLYVQTNGYAVALVLALGVCALGVLISLTFRPPTAAPP
jgi:hypothetical protein